MFGSSMANPTSANRMANVPRPHFLTIVSVFFMCAISLNNPKLRSSAEKGKRET